MLLLKFSYDIIVKNTQKEALLMWDSLDLAIKAAKEVQSNHARNFDIPISFELHAKYKDGTTKECQIKNQLVKTLPEWYWPVLSTEQSITELKNAISNLDDHNLSSLSIIACPKGTDKVVVVDLMDPASRKEQKARPAKMILINSAIENIDDIVSNIVTSERKNLQFTRTVIVCSLESAPDDDLDALLMDDSLGQHQRYGMDGKNAVLWLGTHISNYPAPSSDDVLAAIKAEVARTSLASEIFIVAGDTVDSGDDLALVMNPTIVDTILF